MHCPNCGTSATKQQKFCRACGFGLAKVVQLLEEGDAFQDELSREIADRRQQIERWRNLAFYLFCGGAGFGVLTFIGYGIIYREMIIKGELWEGAGYLLVILTALVGFVLMYLSLQAEELKAEAKRNQVKLLPRPANYPSPDALPPAATTSNLLAEGRVESVASITEDTTRTLQPHG